MRKWIVIITSFIALALLNPGWTWSVLAQSDDPHGNYADVTDACAACHRLHTSSGSPLLYSAAQDNAFCFACHDGTGAPATPVISTHANTDFAGGVEADFGLRCIQCHDPHGNAVNLDSIREHVLVQEGAIPITSGPVVFTATLGLGSYDDGVSDPASRLCVTCHTHPDNSGFPMTNHAGGANHSMGGADFSGQNCLACHPHSTDADRYTQDGFMPGGGCRDCHAQVQDLGGVGPAGGRRAVSLEFGDLLTVTTSLRSHHVISATGSITTNVVTDDDCQVCHVEGATHADGLLQLANVDNPAITYAEAAPGDFRPEAISVANSKLLGPFCLACHDADGAGGDTTPFSDGRLAPSVDDGAWGVSAHDGGGATNGGYGCMGDGINSGCHATGHGSASARLLSAGANTMTTAVSIDALCFDCHTEGMVQNDALSNNRPGGYNSADDIQQAFSKSRVHDLGAAFGIGADTFINQCTTCHNPHVVTGKYWEAASGLSPITRPDFSDPVNNPRAMGVTLWGDKAGEKMDDFAAQAVGSGGWYYSTARGGVISSDQPAVYQPPRAGSGYATEFGGDVLPDYTSLCLDCHTYRVSAANPPVNWGQGIACTDNSVDPPDQRVECGAQHGLSTAGMPLYVSDAGTAGAWGSSGNPDVIFDMNYVTRGRHNGHFMRWPYDSAERSAGINFVLSCTDCHEAHGSDRGGMVRERFNVNANGDCGVGGDPDPNGENCTDGSNWNSFCNACHYYYDGQHSGMSCGNASCHEANSLHRIIHTTDSGAGTQLMLTAAGYEGDFQRPDFTPEIAAVQGHIGSAELAVTFDASQYGSGAPGIFTRDDLSGAIGPDDFWLFDIDGNNPKTITGVAHTAGEYVLTVTLDVPLVAADLDNDLLAVQGQAIWAWYAGGYVNAATGMIPAQVVSAGPWPATITGPGPVAVAAVEAITGSNRLFVEFSEPVYASSDGSGDLEIGDFVLVDADDGRTITGVTYATGQATAILFLSAPVDDIDDIGVDTLAAASNSIYDAYGNPAATDPVLLAAPANGLSITNVYAVDAHDRVVVRFSDRAYANPDNTGALQPSDFVYTDLDGKSIVAVEHAPGDFSAALILSGDVDAANDIGPDTVAAAGDAIFNWTGRPAPTVPAIALSGRANLVSWIANVEGVVGSDRLLVTFATQVYPSTGEAGALQASDFTLVAGGKAINTVQHAAGSSVAIITMDANLTGGDVGVATLAAAGDSIFGPSPGNFPLGVDAVLMSAQPAPVLTRVEGALGYDQIAVSFSEGVYANPDQSGALEPGDFSLTDIDNGRAISGVAHIAGQSSAILTLDAALDGVDDVGVDTLAALGSSAFNALGNPVSTTAVIVDGNDCPTWGASFLIQDLPQASAAVSDESGLLVGNVGNPGFAFPDPLDNDWFTGDEEQGAYIDINYPACLMSPRSVTVEARVRPSRVDRSDGGDNAFNEFNRIFEKRRNFLVTILNTFYRGDDIPSRDDKASLEIKYRTDAAARHSCPHPQWPDDPYAGDDVWMHQISSDIDQWPIVNDHWYQVKIVFNSDKPGMLAGSNGTPVDIFIDDQGLNGDDVGENWPGYVNASKSINASSSCQWGALPGDFIEFRSDDVAQIGANWNHTAQFFDGQIDWVIWKPLADYAGVDDPPY